MRNKILIIHAKWLWDNNYIKEHNDCIHQSFRENDFRDKQGKKYKVRNSKGQFIKYENNNIRTTGNGKDNNVVKSGGSIYSARD